MLEYFSCSNCLFFVYSIYFKIYFFKKFLQVFKKQSSEDRKACKITPLAKSNIYGKCSKISKDFLFLFSNKILVMTGLDFTKKLVRKDKFGQTRIRLLQKQSDLGLPYLSRLLRQATTVRNFRTFTVIPGEISCVV